MDREGCRNHACGLCKDQGSPSTSTSEIRRFFQKPWRSEQCSSTSSLSRSDQTQIPSSMTQVQHRNAMERERERDWKTLTKLITQGLSFDLLQCDKNVPAALSMRESIRTRSSLRTAPVISKRVRVSTQINNKSFFCAKIMSFILSNFIKKIELSKDKKQLVKKNNKTRKGNKPKLPERERARRLYMEMSIYRLSGWFRIFFFSWQAHR